MPEPGAGPTIEAAEQLSALSGEWDPLFAHGSGLQSTRAWFAATAEAALPAATDAIYVAIRLKGRPAALFPLRIGPAGEPASLTSPYTVLYRPLFAPDLTPDAIRQASMAFGRYSRRWATVVLEAMDPDWPGLAPLCDGLAQAGIRTRRFTQFGNWHEAVRGLSWEQYLASRPGQLRETIRRKTRAAARDRSARLQIVQDPSGIAAALKAYEDIYARSWKQPEPFPRFNAALLHRAAELGAARMGVLWLNDQARAAQYWTIWGGIGTVLKLAHDDGMKSLSPGTILTAHMIRHLIEQDHITELDFGRGDDDYKKSWAGSRRQRIGLVLANPWRWRGLLALVQQDIGTVHRKMSNP